MQFAHHGYVELPRELFTHINSQSEEVSVRGGGGADCMGASVFACIKVCVSCLVGRFCLFWPRCAVGVPFCELSYCHVCNHCTVWPAVLVHKAATQTLTLVSRYTSTVCWSTVVSR